MNVRLHSFILAFSSERSPTWQGERSLGDGALDSIPQSPVMDVLMSEQQNSEDRGFLIFFDVSKGIEFLDHSINNAREILAVKVEDESPILQTDSEIDERMERERSHMRFTPPVSTFFQIFFIFDPSRLFDPCIPLQLVHFHEEFMGSMVYVLLEPVHLLNDGVVISRHPSILSDLNHLLLTDFVLDVRTFLKPMTTNVIQISLLEPAGLIHFGDFPSHLAERNVRTNSHSQFRVVLLICFPVFVVTALPVLSLLVVFIVVLLLLFSDENCTLEP